MLVVYSIDLTAAFDLLRYDVLLSKLRKGKELSEGLLYSLMDFLQNRSVYVDIARALFLVHRLIFLEFLTDV